MFTPDRANQPPLGSVRRRARLQILGHPPTLAHWRNSASRYSHGRRLRIRAHLRSIRSTDFSTFWVDLPFTYRLTGPAMPVEVRAFLLHSAAAIVRAERPCLQARRLPGHLPAPMHHRGKELQCTRYLKQNQLITGEQRAD